MFHAIISPLFLLNLAKDARVKWSRLIFFCTINIFLPILQQQIYWRSIALYCTGLSIVEAQSILKNKRPTHSQTEYEKRTPMTLMFAAPHSNPLLKNHCVFSGVELLPTFTGWLNKMGRHFGGFITSMHQIRMNTILYTELNCKSAKICMNQAMHSR